jgi:hypothetical protein
LGAFVLLAPQDLGLYSLGLRLIEYLDHLFLILLLRERQRPADEALVLVAPQLLYQGRVPPAWCRCSTATSSAIKQPDRSSSPNHHVVA